MLTILKGLPLSYFKDLLKTPKMLYEYTKVSEEGASVVRRNLDMNSFKAIKLKVPTFKEQKKILEIFIFLMMKKYQKMKNFKIFFSSLN